MMTMRSRLCFILFMSLFVQLVGFWSAMSKADDDVGFETTNVVLIGGPVLWLVYAVFPLSFFRAFAHGGQLDTDVLDTNGLRFDEVTEVADTQSSDTLMHAQ